MEIDTSLIPGGLGVGSLLVAVTGGVIRYLLAEKKRLEAELQAARLETREAQRLHLKDLERLFGKSRAPPSQ